jgi:hypothetical protein
MVRLLYPTITVASRAGSEISGNTKDGADDGAKKNEPVTARLGISVWFSHA